MKATIMKPIEIEIRYVRVILPMRYGEEDMPNDFPLRNGETWTATIDVDNGQILDWPQGQARGFCMKVCDEGVYCLLDANKNTVAEINQDYVPNGIIPGEYGDYVELAIDANGVITNWPKKPDVRKFFGKDEE